jgi:hypothetical protein
MQKRGGKQWKEGADTCVMDPVVACANNADDVLSPEERKGYVSRIVETGSTDISTGEGIRTFYPDLISERMVSIHRIACTPLYVEEDEVIGEGIRSDLACNNLRNLDTQTNKLRDNSLSHVNLITAKFEGEPYYDEAKRIRKSAVSENAKFQQLFKDLRSAMHAAVSLVDDVGPWYVHTDCHYGNILFNRVDGGINSALADFGRMIMVNNPADDREVRLAVDSWGMQFGLNTQQTLLNFAKYPQHPYDLLFELALFSQVNDESDKISRRNALRGWTPYAILRQTFVYAKEFGQQDYPDLAPILNANSQAELIEAINEFIVKMGGRPGYIKKELIIPSARRGAAVLAQQKEARRRALQMEKQEPQLRAQRKATLKQRYGALEQQAAEATEPQRVTGQTGVAARMFGLGKRRKTRRRRAANASSSRRPPSSPTRKARRSFS